RPLLAAARLVAARNNDNDRDNRPGHTSAVIGLVLSIIFLLLLCCGIHRRRLRQAAWPYAAAAAAAATGQGPRPPLLPLSSPARFPHRMQYGQYNGGSGTIPTAAAADWVPPPYVKEADREAAKYPPPPAPPPPGFDATYAPSNSADFGGGFRPPPAS
ncbi:hypothetical protein B0H14DRAFT_2903808, partial [Mycena olivaceomarginata]